MPIGERIRANAQRARSGDTALGASIKGPHSTVHDTTSLQPAATPPRESEPLPHRRGSAKTSLALLAALLAAAAQATAQPSTTPRWPTPPAAALIAVDGAPAIPLDDPPNPHFPYRCENPGVHHQDVLKLRTGARCVGKILEWGTLVHVWDPAGNRETFGRRDVDSIEFNATPTWKAKPAKPDLTVAWVERIPRDPSWHDFVKYDLPEKKGLGVLTVDPHADPWSPKPGQPVRFIAHVKNVGAAPAPAFAWTIHLDDKPIAHGRTDATLAPDQEVTLEAAWKWDNDPHELRVMLDTESAIDEIAEWNNTFIDPVQARTFFFCVSRNVIESFAKTRNLVDTFSFEDWAQYHVHTMNWLFEHSVYPSAPHGITERVRIDRIVVVEDARDESAKSEWERLRRRNGDPDGLIEYGGTWLFPRVRDDAHAAEWACQMDWGLPHELGHQLGLIDIYQYNTQLNDCLVRDAAGRFVQRHHFFPWPRTMMHWHGPHLFSEACAGYLNKTRGRPRGFYGDYQYDLPARCILEIRGNNGQPLSGVRVEIFQRQSDGEFKGFITDDALAVGTSGLDGRFELPNRPTPEHQTVGGYTLRPNPWGLIDVVGVNGLLLARLSRPEGEEYHFLRIFDFNVAALRGHADTYVHPVQTQFAPPDAPKPIDMSRLFFFDHLRPDRVSLQWPHWGAGQTPPILSYHVFKRTSLGGDEAKPWTLVDVVKPQPPAPPDPPHASWINYKNELQFDGLYSHDTWLAVASVAPNGRESPLSDAQFIPAIDECLRFAVNEDNEIFVPVSGRDDLPMILSILRPGFPQHYFRPFGLRVIRPEFRGYRPSAAGAALDAHKLLIVADARNHQLAWYDRGDLIRLVGHPDRRPEAIGDEEGRFNQPGDVAIDDRGRIYVADRMNHRVQAFDDAGEFLFAFGEKGDGPEHFNEPLALGFASGRLAVTDYGNKRIQIYDVSGDRPVFQRSIPDRRDPDRALVAPSGKVYVCDMDPDGRWGILIFAPDSSVMERAIYSTNQGNVKRPRGLYYDGKQLAFFVNQDPPQFGWIGLK